MAKSKSKIIDEALKDPNIRKLIVNYAGEHSIAVLKLLRKHKEDEKIANELNVKVSEIRAVLNKFNEAGFAYYDRTLDEESGWYYYKWHIDEIKFLKWLEEKIIKEAQKYKYIALEGENYFCERCGLSNIYSFEEAMDHQFRCPICSNPLEYLEEEHVDRFFPKINLTEILSNEKKSKMKRKKIKEKR